MSEVKVEGKKITIDIRSSSHDPHYLARLIWIQLFQLWRDRNFTMVDLDSFLCDLKIMAESYIPHSRWNGEERTFYWDGEPHGFTAFAVLEHAYFCPLKVKITFDWTHAASKIYLEIVNDELPPVFIPSTEVGQQEGT